AHPTPPLFPYTTLFRSRPNVLGLGRFHGLAEGPQDPLGVGVADGEFAIGSAASELVEPVGHRLLTHAAQHGVDELGRSGADAVPDRKSTRLNSSHVSIS